MLFRIDPSNGLAIYDQIGRQLKFAIANGAVPVGNLIPSVRELAGQIAVNPNTVARAYRELQQEGILEPLRGEGLRVAATAREVCRHDRQTLLKSHVQKAITECRTGGLAVDEIRSLVEEVLRETNPHGSTA